MEALNVSRPIGQALAHIGPHGSGTILGFPHDAISNPRGHGVRSEDLQIDQRIFHGPGSVARVHSRAHIALSGRLDQLDQFPGLHVTSVVLHRHLQVRVFGLALDGLERLDHFFDVAVDTAITLSVPATAEVTSRDGAAELPGRANQQSGVVRGLAPFLFVVRFGGGADAAGADL